jgi:hypothetical protein
MFILKARPFLLLASRAFLERHMEGGKKFKIKLYFPTSQKCLHQIFRPEDEKKIKIYFENKFLWVILVH